MNDGFHPKKIIKATKPINEKVDLGMYAEPVEKAKKKTIQKTDPVESRSRDQMKINIHGKFVQLPTVEAIVALQKENKQLRHELNSQKIQMHRMSNELNSFKRQMAKIWTGF